MRQRDGWTPGAATSAVLGLVLVFGLWWAYFDRLATAGLKPAPRRFHRWAATHFPLCFGIAVAAVGIEHVIARDGSVPLGGGGPLLVGAMILVVMALGVLAVTTAGAPAERPVRALSMYAALTLGLVPAMIAGPGLVPVWLLGWLVGLVIVLNVVTPITAPNIS
jgi:low temperature requirement protein LtrA